MAQRSVGAAALPSLMALLMSVTATVPISAAEPIGQNDAAVFVIKAAGKCFSSIVYTTGYVVPRAPAVVMFNAPGFRLTKVSAKEGDVIKAGDVVAEAAPVASRSADPAGSSGTVLIKSLATGAVIKSDAAVGMLTAAQSEPLLTIAINGDMEAAVDVPSIHVLEVEVGQTATISTDDGAEFHGRVRLTPAEIDQKSQVGQARVSISGTALVGRFVHVAIDSSRSCGIAVPRAALTHGSDGIRLQVVKHDIVETRRVQLGVLDEADAYIASGVAIDDLVIADAGTSLRDGDRVRAIFSDPEGAR